MPNEVEVILQINIDRVSCPGVWLCQDGHVALLVFAFGNGFQTRYLPPMFPLNFRDTFYFKKQFHAQCTFDNLGYLLRKETIYCELVQTNDCCGPTTKPLVLAQYLGSLIEVLFPPNVCITEGVDLLMKRTDRFPGILAPKVEISTRIRIDHNIFKNPESEVKTQTCQKEPCRCGEARQQTVCHSPQYHRVKCARYMPRPVSATRSKGENCRECRYISRARSKSPSKCRPPPRQYCVPPSNNNDNMSQCVYRVSTPPADFTNLGADNVAEEDYERARSKSPSKCRPPPRQYCAPPSNNNDNMSQCVYRVSTPPADFTNLGADNVAEEDYESSKSQKSLLESRFIAPNSPEPQVRTRPMYKQKLCTCDICKRYFEMFYKDRPSSC